MTKYCYRCGETGGQRRRKRRTDGKSITEVMKTVANDHHPCYSGYGSILVNIVAVMVMMMVVMMLMIIMMMIAVFLLEALISIVTCALRVGGLRGDWVRTLVTLVTTNLIDVVIGLAVRVTGAGSKVVVGVNAVGNARLALWHGHESCVTKTVLTSFTHTVPLVTMATRLPK